MWSSGFVVSLGVLQVGGNGGEKAKLLYALVNQRSHYSNEISLQSPGCLDMEMLGQ